MTDYQKRVEQWKKERPIGKRDTWANRIIWESNRPSGFREALEEIGLLKTK